MIELENGDYLVQQREGGPERQSKLTQDHTASYFEKTGIGNLNFLDFNLVFFNSDTVIFQLHFLMYKLFLAKEKSINIVILQVIDFIL